MAVNTSYPGVYIEEFTPAPPIQGVGTSTAAFLGPAKSGPIGTPTLVTSFDQFKQLFGAGPLPGFYLWYAVRGFFTNGGTLAYIVRTSNAAAAHLNIPDQTVAATPTLVATARTPGVTGNAITVKADPSSALQHTVVFRHTAAIASASGTAVTFANVDDAARFRPGDIVVVHTDDANRAVVRSVSQHTVTLSQPLPLANSTHSLRLASLTAAENDTVLRLTVAGPDNPVYLASGTVLTLDNTTNDEPVIVQSAVPEVMNLSGGPVTTYRVTLREPVTNDYGLSAADTVVDVTSNEFDLDVSGGTESYQFLSMDPVSPRYFAVLVNNESTLITLASVQPPDPNAPPDNLPKIVATNLASGLDEHLASLLPSDYQAGLDALTNYDVNIVAIPDRQDQATQGLLVDHCQGVPPHFGNRFAILDSGPGAPITGAGSVADQVAPLVGNGSGFAALYYPWILVPPAPPTGGPPPKVAPPNLLVPPSGHVAGLYARIDNARGVHKAPAGIEAGLSGTLGVAQVLGDTEHGLLNMAPYGVNVIRVFRGGRPTVWGARTTAVAAGNTNWQYVNIRRLFIFLEQSISAGIRFALFEPNNLELWGKLKRSITAFLTKVWQDGALFGATAKDAFYVRIDDALNPADQLALGYLTIEIGVRPAYPAEFIVVRIGIWPGGVTVTE